MIKLKFHVVKICKPVCLIVCVINIPTLYYAHPHISPRKDEQIQGQVKQFCAMQCAINLNAVSEL